MGDRTWGTLYVRTADKKVFAKHFDIDPADRFRSIAKSGCSQRYFGEHTPLDEPLPEGLPYIYQHGEGQDYGAHERVYDGFEFSEREMGHQCHGYVLDWEQRDLSLENIEKHMNIRKRVLEKLGLKELP